jgi:Domain of unknown function (DUF4387)
VTAAENSPDCTLETLASIIKSNNAGAASLTFDIVFPDSHTYDAVRSAGVITPALIARLYRVRAEDIQLFHSDILHAIKITIPRQSPAGGVDERDFDGTQQYVPLLGVKVDLGAPVAGQRGEGS